MKKAIVILIVVLIGNLKPETWNCHAQDIHFSQFYLSSHILNPALTGASGFMEGMIQYKEQWRSIAVPYKTMGASYSMRYNKKKWDQSDKKRDPFLFKRAPGQGLAWGITLYNDKAGDAAMKSFQTNASLAYHVMITKNMVFAAGLQGGVASRTLDYTKLEWGSQYNGKKFDPIGIPTPDAPVPAESMFYPDFGGGLLWYYEKEESAVGRNDNLFLTAGGAIFHVNEPPYSFYGNADEKLYQKTVLHFTGNIGIKGTPLSLLPGAAWFQQGSATEILMGGLVNYRLQDVSKYTGRMKGASIAAGVHYRNRDAVIIASQLQLAQYSIGISYDLNTSNLKTASSGKGGFEISIRFLDSQQYLYQNKKAQM